MKNKQTLKQITLFLFFLVPLASLRAAELDGYPYDVFAKYSDYKCTSEQQPEQKGTQGHPDRPASMFKLCIAAKGFDRRGVEMMRRSFLEIVDELYSDNLYACVAQSLPSLKAPADYFTSEIKFVDRFVATPLRVRNLQDGFGFMPYVFISSLASNPKTPTPKNLGEGYLGFFEDGPLHRTNESLQVLSLAARGDLIGAAGIPNSDDQHFWATVLFMSFLKNLGISDQEKPLANSAFELMTKCFYWRGAIPAAHQTLKENP